MSFARAISRGAFLKARFGVNGTKNASRSFGTVGASGRVASDIFYLSCERRVRGLPAPIPAIRGARNAGQRISTRLWETPRIHQSGIVQFAGVNKFGSNIK